MKIHLNLLNVDDDDLFCCVRNTFLENNTVVDTTTNYDWAIISHQSRTNVCKMILSIEFAFLIKISSHRPNAENILDNNKCTVWMYACAAVLSLQLYWKPVSQLSNIQINHRDVGHLSKCHCLSEDNFYRKSIWHNYTYNKFWFFVSF